MEIPNIFINTKDYRVVGRCTHPLSDILGLCLCGIIADCDDLETISPKPSTYFAAPQSYVILPATQALATGAPLAI